MKRVLLLLILFPSFLFSQQLDSLTIEKIMSDPIWIGTSPSNVFWSSDSKAVYFDWNPETADEDSLYRLTLNQKTPQKVSFKEAQLAKSENRGTWNADHNLRVFVHGSTLYLRDVSANTLTALVQTSQHLSNPQFIKGDTEIAYRQGNNLFSISIKEGRLRQLSNFKTGKEKKDALLNREQKFLKEDALENSQVLTERNERKEKRKKLEESVKDLPDPIYLGNKNLTNLSVSPDGEAIFYQLSEGKSAENTEVPNYVTISGHAENINARPKVGSPDNTYGAFIVHRKTGNIQEIDTEQIPGIHDIPTFYEDYPEVLDSLQKEPPLRRVTFSDPIWNPEGSKAFFVINALDHKDRWIMSFDVKSGSLELLDRQHDDAWIGGPGIMGYSFYPGNVGWIDNQNIWFHSEESGYSHLYTINIDSKKKTALTAGKFEVQNARLSPNRKTFYITANEVAPGAPNFYQLILKNKKLTRITTGEGGFQTTASPDGKYIAFLHSTIDRPWELYLQKNQVGASKTALTDQAESDEFKSYPWRTPETFTFTNRDGDEVYAQVYKPKKQAASNPGVLFVHGAGYLQDIKDTWSDAYFREHLFMNLLADHGYTVMNIDYRASAGYGRDWRTAIYRHMGKNDLADNVDGARYMVEHFNVNPENIGIWGGSYGGFMTLMALFKTDVFAAGGALRSVTDWAHYNHGYTSNILNLPQNDPKAYRQSSPIYFADGLQDHLLMPHGMIDTNVHFQDIVRLTQKLIELGKENWELAVYPMENHGFVEPSSWTDEYKRIFKLFEGNLK